MQGDESSSNSCTRNFLLSILHFFVCYFCKQRTCQEFSSVQLPLAVVMNGKHLFNAFSLNEFFIHLHTRYIDSLSLTLHQGKKSQSSKEIKTNALKNLVTK